MRRREFIVLLSSAIAAQPLGVWAQVTPKRPLIAVLLGSSSITAVHWLSGFPQGLKELSYVEDRNIDIAYRATEKNDEFSPPHPGRLRPTTDSDGPKQKF